MQRNRIAIIDGLRTPMAKSGGVFADFSADELCAITMKEILYRNEELSHRISEVIVGNVATPVNAPNIARVSALRAGLPIETSAFTVGRNCASGMEAVTSSMMRLKDPSFDIILASGTESMSNIPFYFHPKTKQKFEELAKSKHFLAKMKAILSFRPKDFIPKIGILEGLTDPICGKIMGLTAEILAKEFAISRLEQDEYAQKSHEKTAYAYKSGFYMDEILPVAVSDTEVIEEDDTLRKDQTIKSLQKLRPVFQKEVGSVTVGNSCSIADGAMSLLLMREIHAKKEGIKPLGYLRSFAYTGLEPERMGLGPYYSIQKLLEKEGLSLSDIDLFEINEAFAAQVIANLRMFKENGETLPTDKLNVNGGAIALGHPVGISGMRIIHTLLREMQNRGVSRGIASLCIGGGQGGAVLLERE